MATGPVSSPLCYQDAVPLMSTNWSQAATVRRFPDGLLDPTQVILEKVTLTVQGRVVGSVGLENLDMAPAIAGFTWGADVDVELPNMTPLATISISQTNNSVNLSAFDGAIDFMGSSGFMQSFDISDMQVIELTAPADLALFTGMGNVSVPARATGISSAFGAANAVAQFATSAEAMVEVCYEYSDDCNSNGVPDDQELAGNPNLDRFSPGPPESCMPNGVLDECEPFTDCDMNGVPDVCDIVDDPTRDMAGRGKMDTCGPNGVLDVCENIPDCDGDGMPDACEEDCDGDGLPDDCEPDCDMDGLPDDCEEDCNSDGVPDDCEPDCDGDGIPDGCEPDCDGDGTPDDCDNDPDCNGNGEPDNCETGPDCNGNGIPDECEPDCDGDGIPDGCEPDCDADGTPDDCEPDCDADGIPDDCDGPDCNGNGLPDNCDLGSGFSQDCDGNSIPDECQPDCDGDGTPDACEADCDGDGTPDDCDSEPDCNGNGVPDNCDVAAGGDCDGNGVPDECQPDCDSDGTPDVCEPDCDGDGTPDECDNDPDCNGNGVPDNCEGGPDCNGNGIPDNCEPDCDGDGVPDDCEPDCDGDGLPDDCENDCNGDGVPDDCELDCDGDGVPDGCENDCSGDGVPDDCEPDCDGDGTPDPCEDDCNGDGVPDDCEPDCDGDMVPDPCEPDCDMNGIPDDCEPFEDCNQNDIPDRCDISSGNSQDMDGDGVPDECDCLKINRREKGSLLLYPEFDNRPGSETFLTITNGRLTGGNARVEFVWINKDDCLEFNHTEVLTPLDTVTFDSAVRNPEDECGYVYAFAKNEFDEAITDNCLFGQVLRLDGFDASEYAINAVTFRGRGMPGQLTDVDGDGIRDLNNLEYDPAPDSIYIPRFFAQGNAYDSELILIALSGGAQFQTLLKFWIYNDNEQAFSRDFQFYCWERVRLADISNAFTRNFLLATNQDDNEILGLNEETGWMEIDGNLAFSQFKDIFDPAFYAVLVSRNTVTTSSASDLPWECCSQLNGSLLPLAQGGDNED